MKKQNLKRTAFPFFISIFMMALLPLTLFAEGGNGEKKAKSKPIQMQRGDALVIVDPQNDFCPGGGSLPVPLGDEIMPVLNRLMRNAQKKGIPIILTRDWHPQNHHSFQPNGKNGIWPVHCVRGSKGAEFHSCLKVPENATIVDKGTIKQKEAYSGFAGTNLKQILRKLDVNRVFVGGLALDFCVKATAMDAAKNRFETVLVADACRAVNAPGIPGEKEALEEMEAQGIRIIKKDE